MSAPLDVVATVTGVVAVVNPLGAVPTWLSMSERIAPQRRARVAWTISVAVAAVLVAAALAGDAILRAFGVSLPAFRIAGGLLLLLLAISRMDAAPEPARSDAAPDDTPLVPLGIPTLAGPGAIGTIVLRAREAATAVDFAVVLVAAVAAAVATFLTLRSAHALGAWLGPAGLRVVVRVTALLLAAVGVEFIAGGVAALFPAVVR